MKPEQPNDTIAGCRDLLPSQKGSVQAAVEQEASATCEAFWSVIRWML
jgi:hypothetical protein